MSEIPERIWLPTPNYVLQEEGSCLCFATWRVGAVEYVPRAVMDAAVEKTVTDALFVAQGCLDYGGGYRSSDEKLAIFHHGIQTVINSLMALKAKGLEDTQVAALYRSGRNAAKGEK